MKKVFGIALLAVLGLFLVACGDDATTTVTTVDQTTVETTTAVQTTTTETPVDLTALIDDLKTQYATTLEDVNFLATENLTLVATVGDLTITWSSGNVMYLENDGTIHRPSYTTGNQTVVLTASITDGTDTESYGFFVTVQALDKTDQERADEVFVIVTAFPTKEKWTVADESTLVFLTTGKDLDNVDYTVVWTSSLPGNLSVDGDLVQPAVGTADVVVTMTATITIGAVDYTKDVIFTIAKIEDAIVVTTIAAAALEGEDSYVQITGVTVTDLSSDGNIFLTDGTDLIYVYGPSFEVSIGDVIDITGEFAYYYNAPQLQGTPTHPLLVAVSTADAVAVPVNTPASLMDLIGGLTVPTSDAPWSYEYYTVTAKIYYNDDDAWGNYTTFLVPTDYDFTAALADGATQPNGDSIMIYYKSNMDVLSTLHGEEITLTILTQGWRSDKTVYYANFFGTAEDLSVAFADDATAVAAALASFMYPAEVVENATLFMPASVYGVDLEYASDDAIIIDPTTGAVDLTTLTTQVEVMVTITATKGSVTASREITINVGILPLSTTVEAQAAADDVKLKVQGIVIASEYQNTYMIQDDLGGITIYTYDSTLQAFLAANVGNKVEVIGNKDSYKGLQQIAPDTITLVEESTVPAATNLDVVLEADLFGYQGMLVEFTDLYVLSVDANDGGYGNFFAVFIRISDGAIIEMKWDARVDLTTEALAAINALVVGDKVTVIAGLGWYDGARIFYTDSTVLTVGTAYTDAELLAASANVFPADAIITESVELPELQFGTITAIVISPELQAYLTDDSDATNSLILVLPNGDVTGTVTLTLTLNAETLDVVVNLTLDGMTDAEKLTADEASLTVQGTAVANETIVLPLEGTLGTTVAWTVVSGTATLDVDGKTLVFADATADYDVVLEATLSIGTETDVTKQFTVNVTGITIISDFTTLYTQAVVDVWDVTNDITIYVQGTVSGFGYNALYLQDANGVGVKISGNSYGDLSLGDTVLIGGVLEEYGDVRQFDWNPTLIAVVSTGNAVTPVVMTNDEINNITVADTGKLITVTGAEFFAIDGSYYTFKVTGTALNSIIISTHYSNVPDWFDDIYVVGDTINDLTFVFSKFNEDLSLSIECFDLVQTEADKVNADAAQLPTTLILSADEVLPLPMYGSTFTVTAVSSEITPYIDFTTTSGTLLVLSTPVVAAVGTVTVDVTQGGTTVTVTIAVTVETPVVATLATDLFISEYGEGTSNNKWIEIYNGTGADVDLSAYSVEVYSNGSDTAGNTLSLTGTLLAGDVYVIYNSSADALIAAEGDITSSVTYFNGDDAVSLSKDGTVIDVIGVIGVDPGSNWVVGTGSTGEHTLVRDPSVTGPTTVFDPTEWLVYDQDTFDYVGVHTME